MMFVIESHSPVKKPRVKRARITLPNYYSKVDEDFYDTVKSCACYIDYLGTDEDKIKYSKRLNKIFVIKDSNGLLMLYKDLIHAQRRDGENCG